MRTIKTILIALLVTTAAFADVAVEGTISDANTGDPLIGAQVIVKGTFMGITTDQDGMFSLNVGDDASLIFTYIGYKTQETTITPGMGSLSIGLLLFQDFPVGLHLNKPRHLHPTNLLDHDLF